jgi:hypothetical protein
MPPKSALPAYGCRARVTFGAYDSVAVHVLDGGRVKGRDRNGHVLNILLSLSGGNHQLLEGEPLLGREDRNGQRSCSQNQAQQQAWKLKSRRAHFSLHISNTLGRQDDLERQSRRRIPPGPKRHRKLSPLADRC